VASSPAGSPHTVAQPRRTLTAFPIKRYGASGVPSSFKVPLPEQSTIPMADNIAWRQATVKFRPVARRNHLPSQAFPHQTPIGQDDGK
jgi:hypothetical protein